MLFFILIVSAPHILAQDSTSSQVFRNDLPRRQHIIKAKYPSYSLIAGYVLATDANKGDPFAQHELGIRYLMGSGFPKDTVKAIYWIRKAVDQNLPAARFNYGILLYNGIGVPWNPFEAYQNFNAASDAALPESQFALGLLYTDNLAVNRDFGKAYKLFKISADGKYPPAIEAITQMLKSGFIPPNDSTFIPAANRKDEAAQVLNPNWELDYFDFENEVKDTSTAFIKKLLSSKKVELKKHLGLEKFDSTKVDTTSLGLLEFAANNGSPEALFLLAKKYEKGINVKKDIAKAASYYLQANRLGSYKAGETLYLLVQDYKFIESLKTKVNLGDAEAMYSWAAITALGYSSQIANQQALDLLKKAVEKKHIPSMIELGLLYMNGTLVEKNKEKAFSYLQMANSFGSTEAEIRIAFANIMDKGKEADLSKEITTLQKLSGEGSVFSQTVLAYCYEKGIGLKEDKAVAVKLYRGASQRGNQSALNSLKRMYDELRPDDETFKIFETN
ncbi:MAG: Sel1 domain-containing protein [Ignavibacteria bacterium]|nr:MAG: Sel1 domain-containing protein [Ignavibacteria bacterium]KAF0161014.1 MAG: Sel1 domain-containing protein [Ignavibacteria bacterium]